MSTASIMSSLLNASGLKERLSEYGGKAKLSSPDFPLMENDKPGNEALESRFSTQFEGLAGDKEAAVSDGDLPAQENMEVDGEPLEEEVSALVDGEAEAVDVPAVTDEGLLPEDNDTKPAATVAAASASVTPQEQPDRIKAGAETDHVKAGGPVDRLGNDMREQVLPRTGGEASAVRSDTGMTPQAAQAFGRYGANEFTHRSGRAGEVRQPASDSAVSQGLNGRPAAVPGNAPLVTVTGFSMASVKSDYPANFTEKFSQQLDMMRPVFKTFPGSEGIARALEAGGQPMPALTGNVASGTLQQVQQAIQTTLVDLARESTGNSSPTARTMELSLVPRSLGEIKVHMMHAGNRISVEIVTSTVAATQAMETAKNDIVKAYLQFGIQPEEVNIRVTEIRDATQPALQAGSDQDRLAQGGQGLARHGAGSSMAEQREATRQQETGDNSAAGDEGLKRPETAKPVRSDVMGKVQYF